MDLYLENLKKILFKSVDRNDWVDKEAWIRRAMFWKLTAMGLESHQNCDEKGMKKVYEAALGADLQGSPDIRAIKAIADLSIPLFNNRLKKKIILAKG